MGKDEIMILKLLYRAFPSAFHRLVFESQRKPVNFDKLQFAFVDSAGNRYYKYMSDFDMTIVRQGAFEMKMKELNMGLNRDELGDLMTAIEAALKETDKQGNMRPNIARIGYFVEEIKNRKENLIHPDILMEMACLLYIREDENPAIVDAEIQNQKFAQFTKDSETGLTDFFLTAELDKYVPFLRQFGGDSEALWNHQRSRLKAYKAMMQSFSTEGQSGSS